MKLVRSVDWEVLILKIPGAYNNIIHYLSPCFDVSGGTSSSGVSSSSGGSPNSTTVPRSSI